LHDLRRGDSLRDPELRHYDSLALALKLLDTVIDSLGMEDEADRDQVLRVLTPVLRAMDEAAGIEPSSQRHENMTDKILAHLRNDANARRPFREEYAALAADGSAGRHAIEFRLLSDAFHISGRTVLRPSSEACNLYLRLLDLDIEDAQAAAEAVVASQLARGRFNEAVLSARQARIQTLRYREQILKIVQDTRRDVDRVDWKTTAPQTLDAALDHIARRHTVERGIIDAIDERLTTIGDAGDDARQTLVNIGDLIRGCQLIHTELHNHLMAARNVFLDTQARQSFREQPVRPLPDLYEQVLTPLLRLPVRAVEPVLNRSFTLLAGPRPPAVPILHELIAWQLHSPRTRQAREIAVEETDPTQLEREPRLFTEEAELAAAAALGQLREPAALSQIITAARARREPPPAIELLVLTALRAFASEDQAALGFAAEPLAGELLRDPAFYGDDLLVQPAEEIRDGR